jgi:hypothetical protein
MVPAILGAAFALFLLTPRHANPEWNFGLRGIRGLTSGLGDGSIDLNRTGRIQPNNEVVMEVYARNADGTAKVDLDEFQRWRSTTLSSYSNGRWPRIRLPSRGSPAPEVPDLGPNQFTLTFVVRRQRLTTLYVAEPLLTTRENAVPILPLWRGLAESTWLQLLDGTMIPMDEPLDGRYRYQQITAPVGEPHLSLPLERFDPHPYDRSHRYLKDVPERIGPWTVCSGWLPRAPLRRPTWNAIRTVTCYRPIMKMSPEPLKTT